MKDKKTEESKDEKRNKDRQLLAEFVNKIEKIAPGTIKAMILMGTDKYWR